MATKSLDESSKSERLVIDLRNLLMEGRVTTQEDICLALESAGHVINQSKVSRLLHKINAIKSKNELGQVVYRLPQEPAPPTTSSDLTHLVIEILSNESLIVVRTSPGAAQLIARIIDYHREKLSIIGTIAGDDTIFITLKSVQLISAGVHQLQKLLLN